MVRLQETVANGNHSLRGSRQWHHLCGFVTRRKQALQSCISLRSGRSSELGPATFALGIAISRDPAQRTI